MGEILETMIQALEQRLDTGVLHDLNSTRLHMLIGEEFVKNSRQLPDSSETIDVIEQAMKKYFGTGFESEEAKNKPEEADTEEKVKSVEPPEPVKFKLNVRKNPDNFHAIVNKIPVLFSPVILKNYLNNLVKQTLEKSSPGLFHQTIENIAFINSSTMLADVIKSLPKSDEFQQLRLGMVIFKLLGYGDSKIFKEKNSWGIPLIIRRETDLNFCLGYVKGIFKTAMPEKFNNLDFKIMESPVAISVEFL